MSYTFTYESDWKQAETLILNAAEDDEMTTTAHQAQKLIDNMAKDFAIRIRNTAPVVRTRAAASGIELTLRFLAHPRRQRRLMDRVNRRIMEAVDQADNIDFAYNTIRVMPTSPVIDHEKNGSKKRGQTLNIDYTGRYKSSRLTVVLPPISGYGMKACNYNQ